MSRYISQKMQKDYEEALKTAMAKSGVDITFTNNYTYNPQQSSGNTSNGTYWYACWGADGGHFITEKDFIPTKIIFNPPATICYFPDGSKIIVKCASDEEFVEEEGVMACIVKKIFKSRNAFKKLVKNAYRQPKNEPKVETEPDISTTEPENISLEPTNTSQTNISSNESDISLSVKE